MDESSSPTVGRRRFLGALSAAVGSGVAGCPGTVGETERSGGTDLTPAPVPTIEAGADVLPGLSALPCPRFPGGAVVGNRVCATAPDDPLALVAYDRRAGLPTATLRFQFRNSGPEPLSGLSPPWSLQKFVDGEWHVVRPLRIRSGTDSAATGAADRRTWSLAVDNGATRRLDPGGTGAWNSTAT
ncbi:hypothetical protein ACFQL1_00780 [Halomicroarcula sp. GCM10025709]|uniref:hypothetical protein n=1 Tax=Halomicroarcula sp. GCM10025709 TaxID=3252669 RepID=UPI0036142F0D